MINHYLPRAIDIHAFLAWFDISFDCTHKKVSFSTGPHAKYTHWKYVSCFYCPCWHLFNTFSRQTVFYTPSTITIQEGQEVTGQLSCAPNARNNRDLDITISDKCSDLEESIDYKMCAPRSRLPDPCVGSANYH